MPAKAIVVFVDREKGNPDVFEDGGRDTSEIEVVSFVKLTRGEVGILLSWRGKASYQG